MSYSERRIDMTPRNGAIKDLEERKPHGCCAQGGVCNETRHGKVVFVRGGLYLLLPPSTVPSLGGTAVYLLC